MSKDVKPKQRLGRPVSIKRRIVTWSLLFLAAAGGGFAAWHYGVKTTKVDAQVPDPRIVKLADSGRPIKKGDVVVQFDAAQQEQNYLEKNTSVRTADSEIVQLKAQQEITHENDGMNLMTSEYNVERAKLEASKAEVLSEIEGAKNQIDVGVSKGGRDQVKTTIKAHK